MKSNAPTLMPLLRSDLQGEVLARLSLWPDQEFSIADLARLTGASAVTVMREVNRIESSGLATSRSLGRARLVRAVTGNATADAVRTLMDLTYGPRLVVREELEAVPGVEHAYIYGSWADRRSGNPGPVPHDIDVLVVGHPDRAQLDDAAFRAEQRLHREVNPRIVSPKRWNSEDDPFVNTVRSRPLIDLEVTAP